MLEIQVLKEISDIMVSFCQFRCSLCNNLVEALFYCMT